MHMYVHIHTVHEGSAYVCTHIMYTYRGIQQGIEGMHMCTHTVLEGIAAKHKHTHTYARIHAYTQNHPLNMQGVNTVQLASQWQDTP